MGSLGVVAAGHVETARAATAMLEDGGNAYDAALAALCAACVAEPVLCSLGGGGFLTARPAGGAPVVYDFFPQTPRTAPDAGAVDFFPIVADFGTARQEFHIGMASMATPGMVAGLFRVHRDLGTLPLARIVEPAVALARGGVEVNRIQADVLGIVRAIYLRTAECRAHFESPARPGEPLGAGERFVLPTFADSLLALVREGEDLFYRGEMAQSLVADCRARGGLLGAADLESYRVALRRPLHVALAGARVHINPPPSNGGILVAFGIELLRESGLARHGFGSAGHLVTLAGAMRATVAARAAHDPAVLLDPALVARWRDEVAGGRTAGRGTTQISVADAKGNLAALTVTNGEGASYFIPGTGIMVNNMLGESDLNPDGFHAWPADTRLRSMMAPGIIEHADGGVEAFGSGGSNRIRTAILQVLANELVFGMGMEDAISAPRIHFDDGLLSVEAGFPAESIAALRESFPRIEAWEDVNFFFGGMHAAGIDRTGAFHGFGDPRRGGVAITV